jgi:aminomethyltransferase
MLRIEAGFILFANELRFPVTPAELDLARFAAGRGSTPRIHFVGFRAETESDPVLFAPSADAAFPPAPGTILVSSACRSAALGGIIGLGYVAAGSPRDIVDPTGTFQAITVVGLPFIGPDKRRPRGAWEDDAVRS